jgi:sugar O-acyltransferase (sialic acid O-acetyltransferase NeuD family)
MSREIVIFGTGDFARVAKVYLEEDSPHTVAAFTVHEQYCERAELLGRPVVAFERLEQIYPPSRYGMFVAMGFSRLNKARAEIYSDCKRRGYELVSYVCSKAACWGEVELGDNCFIFENNVLQPFVRIGNDVILWSGNHIGHDAEIGNHCFIASHAVVSGNVRIGDHCFLGVNSTIRDGVTVGSESVIGAGALIVKDVPPGSVYKGVAAELSPVPSSRLKAI